MTNTNTDKALALIFTQQETNDGLVRTIEGKHLHHVLEISSKYYDWVSRAITAAQLVENVDYVIENSKTSSREYQGLTTKQTVHHFTVDASKILAMMARSVVGAKVRQHLIAVEKEYQAIVEAEKLQLLKMNQVLEGNIQNLTVNGSLSSQAIQQQYYPANEIKAILKLKTGTKVIKEVSDYYMVRTIEVGVRTYIHLTDFIKAWDTLLSESDLKTIHCKVTYQHSLSNIVFEA